MRYIALITILGICLTSCSTESENPHNQMVVPVFAENVKTQDVPLFIESIGTLKSSGWVEVRPQVSGMLAEVHFKDGQFVKKGDLLLTIDQQPYLNAQLEAEAQLTQSQAAYQIAQKKLERYQELSKKNLISEQEWDELQAEAIKQKAQLQASQARAAAANLNLKNCSIQSPIDGRTGKLLVHPGNLVGTTPLVTVSNIEKLTIDFTLTEREFQQLKPEQLLGEYAIEVCSYTNKCQQMKATLTFLNNTFDEQTGLLNMQGSFDNFHHQFLPGQHVNVRVPMHVIKNAMVIPQKAVKINQTGPYVFAIKEDSTIEIKQIKLGDEIEKQVVVLEGLEPTAKIVTEGHLRLSPGMKVEVK
jgi:multidrug efflux system membrane fusion protein